MLQNAIYAIQRLAIWSVNHLAWCPICVIFPYFGITAPYRQTTMIDEYHATPLQ